MQAHARQLLYGNRIPFPGNSSNDTNGDVRIQPVAQKPEHRSVTDTRVIKHKFAFRALYERRELFTGIEWAYDEVRRACLVRLPLGVCFEKFSRLLHEPAILCDQTEAAAFLDVLGREIVGQHE